MIHKYRRLINYALRQWPILVLIIGATLPITAFAALRPWPLKILVDYALGQVYIPEKGLSFLNNLSLSPTPITLIALAAVSSFGIFVIQSALDMGLSFAWVTYGQRMVYELAADLFNRLQRLSLLFHQRRNVGDTLNRLEGDTYCIYSIADGLLVSPVQNLLKLTTIGIIAWNLNKELTLLSLIVAPILAGTSFYFGPRFTQKTRLVSEARSRLMSLVHQTLTAIPVVKAFGTERQNKREFNRLAEDSVVLSQKNMILNASYSLLNDISTTLGTALILYVGGMQVLSGTLTLGSLLVFLAYLGTLQGGFKNLMGIYSKQKSVEAHIDRVIEIMDSKDMIEDAPEAKPIPYCSNGAGCQVRLENIIFGYEPGRPVLNEVTLEARPGETVAIVGPTGAGKSTLISLIPRFFDPWEGRILLDGKDIREIQLSSLRSQIAIVLQEPFLLPLSVAENIAYGKPEASREAIISAARAANADEFIQQLPEKYETIIGERGATLSGGQMQRLAIARAFLKDTPILILDEPTSSLDAAAESQLLYALEHLMKARTTFIIAHRLSTIQNSDRIVVLERGKIVEEGTHRDLIAAHGPYHRLYSLQFQETPRKIVI